MIIQNAQIQFAHAHELKEEYRQRETLFTQRPDNEDGSAGQRATLESREIEASRTERSLAVSRFQNESPENATSQNPEQDLADLSRRGRALAESLERIRERLEQGNGEERENGFLDIFGNQLAGLSDEDAGLDAETYQLKSIVESFTGKEIKLSVIAEDVEADEEGNTQDSRNVDGVAVATPEQAPPTVTASLVYQYQESYLEEETSLFSATGSVTLESGETLDIDFSQFSQRSFYLENSLELTVGEVELTDPLVVNLQGPGLSLSEQKYQFDLDNDGETENINFATGNSGFLALDRNQNGVIDDGTELFGALSGNGFADLSALDEDGNGFIDSGDGVFTELLFYQKDANGQDFTQKISDLGIGALYLGHQATPFQVKDADNELQAVVRSSGIFINENGSTGSLQQIDLVV